MTRQEMIDQINTLASEYLGFPSATYGLKSRRKADLETMLTRYQRMMRRERQARKLLAEYTREQQFSFVLNGDAAPERYRIAMILKRQAHEMWLGGGR